MKVILEVLSAFASTVTVIDAKYLYIGPVLDNWQFICWMNDI
jgi:hypothetical protein